MQQILANIASSHALVGLATVSGLIPLAIYLFYIVRWLWQSRLYIYKLDRKLSRAEALTKVKEFRRNDKLIKAGLSEYMITYADNAEALTCGFISVLNGIIGLMQIMFYVSFKSQVSFFVAVMAFCFSIRYIGKISEARLRGMSKLIQMKHRAIEREELANMLATVKKKR